VSCRFVPLEQAVQFGGVGHSIGEKTDPDGCVYQNHQAAVLLADVTVAGQVWRSFSVAMPSRVIQVSQPLAIRRKLAADAAYAQADLGPADLDFAEVHDAVSPAELMYYRELGFCREGEVAQFVRDKRSALGGSMPVNPSGGLNARGHPVGATGVAQIVELTKQLRGDAGGCQVQGARIGLAHNAGGWNGEDPAVCVVHILEAQG